MKSGDKVKVIKPIEGFHEYENQEGTVLRLDDNPMYEFKVRVLFENLKGFWFKEDELEIL